MVPYTDEHQAHEAKIRRGFRSNRTLELQLLLTPGEAAWPACGQRQALADTQSREARRLWNGYPISWFRLSTYHRVLGKIARLSFGRLPTLATPALKG